MIVRPRRLRTKVLGYLFGNSTNDTSTSTSVEYKPKYGNQHSRQRSITHIYTAIPSSPTSTISSIDPSSPRSYSSKMSSDIERERRESYPLSEASTSSSTSTFASSSNGSSYHEKQYIHNESDEDDFGFEFDSSESSGLLGFLPKWRRDLEDVVLSLPSTSSSQNRKQRRRRQKNENKGLFSLTNLGIAVFAIIAIGGIYVYLQRPSTSSYLDESIYFPLKEVDNSTQVENIIPQWAIDVREIPNDPTHILIPPHENDLIELLPELKDRLPYEVLESYFSTGLIPESFHHEDQQSLDLVYLFVNATSEYLQENMLLASSPEKEEGISIEGKKRHWRDNGELRGAIRSGIKNFIGTENGKVHVISADWKLSDQDIENLPFDNSQKIENLNQWRIGQIPEWLNWDSQKDSENQKLRWHFHSDIFKLPRKSNGQIITKTDPSIEPPIFTEIDLDDQDYDLDNDTTPIIEGRIEPPKPIDVFWNDEEEWKNLSMPNFNSFAIESRMSWLQGVSENFVALNDDMFILRSLSKSDFRHPLLGSVLRMDSGLLVNPSTTPMQLTDSGEWGALQYANKLISHRFPSRRRMYLHHLPKIQSKSILHEAVTMFKEELSVSSTREFRESKKGKGDIEMAWLTTNLRIERWRESLLWSYIIAKIGAQQNGYWNNQSRLDFINLMGITNEHISGQQRLFIERRTNRMTLFDSYQADQKSNGKWEDPKASFYQFSSLDGHLNLISDDKHRQCMFSLDQCLPSGFLTDSNINYTSEEIFKLMTFKEPSCGDCLIHALINQSGERGLEAFLPSPEQVHYPASTNENSEKRDWITTEPILPLTNSWENSDFSIESNVFEGQDVWSGSPKRIDGGIELRRWVIKLLSRYNYVFASTPSLFSPIHNSAQMILALKQVEESNDLAMFCINDDQYDSSDGQVKRLFGDWMNDKFGDLSSDLINYEKPNIEWEHLDLEDREFIFTFPDPEEDEEQEALRKEILEKLQKQNEDELLSRGLLGGGGGIRRGSRKINHRTHNSQLNNNNEQDYNEHGWDITPDQDVPDADW
ncbi:uncharacterized protein L201_001716 [Kwoniella dendrophila CBS 6074]|uniref:Stealth protein CR3 conserved region 3 domain-containing protein n=1 Tax=Kwoniella dendrophila CBS 6074 TaxID=1295534 RepID=A0AAX4JN88_9TREE